MDDTKGDATDLNRSNIKRKLYAKIQLGYDAGDTIAVMTHIALNYHCQSSHMVFDDIIDSIKHHIGCSFEERTRIMKDVILPQLISKNIFPTDSDNASACAVAGLLCHFTLCNDAACGFCKD